MRPTVFANVTSDMTIAKEEIFGPVLAMLPSDSEADAIAMANDTVYGLSGGYVRSACDLRASRKPIASQLRGGNVHMNGRGAGFTAPSAATSSPATALRMERPRFREFLETKAVLGFEVKAGKNVMAGPTRRHICRRER